jgi:hypothetical protein
MNLIREISTKRLSGTSAGELIKISAANGFHFGIVLAADAKPPMVGFLQPTGTAGLVYRRLPDTACISYGTDWAIEAIPDEDTRPGNSKHQVVSGALFVAERTVVVCFQPSRETDDSIEVYLNLTTGLLEDTYPRELAAPFRKWNIWESRESYQRPGNEPLVKVDVSQ